MRGCLAGIMLILSVMSASAQAGDRMLGIDMDRDKAENRIDKLHQDKGETAKAKADKSSTKTKTPSKQPKKKDY